MRKTDFRPLGPVIDDVFKKLGIDKKMKEIAAKEAWGEVVGPMFANATRKITIYNNVLFVYVSSPAVRHELSLNRRKILHKINEKVGEEIIVDIIIK